MWFFLFFVLPYLKEQLGDLINDGIIDIGIYSNGGRNFRTAESTNFGQDRPLRIISNHNEKDSLITCIPSSSVLIDLKPNKIEKKVESVQIKHSDDRIELLDKTVKR